MTRREALDWFLGRVGELGDVVARNRAERSLTTAIDSIWMRRQWTDFTPALPLSLTLTAGRTDYPLPSQVGRVRTDAPVINATLGGRPLDVLHADDFRALYSEAGTAVDTLQGPPRLVALGGVVGVHTQPSTAGEALNVVSTSAADTAVRVTIEGEDASGVEQRVSVLLQGTSQVALGTFRSVSTFAKAYTLPTEPTTELTSSAGSVILRTTAASTVLQTLLPDETAREHRVLTVFPTPDAAYVLHVPYLRRPRRLLYDSDPLPMDWDNAVLEEMLIEWRVGTGEVAHDNGVARPKFLELLAFDIGNGPPRQRRPFSGARG